MARTECVKQCGVADLHSLPQILALISHGSKTYGNRQTLEKDTRTFLLLNESLLSQVQSHRRCQLRSHQMLSSTKASMKTWSKGERLPSEAAQSPLACKPGPGGVLVSSPAQPVSPAAP